MTLALSPSPATRVLSSIIVSDIAPTQSSLSPSFTRYLKAMSTIEDPTSGITRREEAGMLLEGVEKVCSLIILLPFQ